MNEEKRWQVPVCNMRLLSKTNNLEYIPVCSDPTRRVHVSDMPETVSAVRNVHKRIEQQSCLYEAMDKVCSVMGFIACMAMFALLIRMSYGSVWV